MEQKQTLVSKTKHIVDVVSGFKGEATKTVDATGCVILPGLVDLHTHLREPGR